MRSYCDKICIFTAQLCHYLIFDLHCQSMLDRDFVGDTDKMQINISLIEADMTGRCNFVGVDIVPLNDARCLRDKTKGDYYS